jgi:hypothetical protein
MVCTPADIFWELQLNIGAFMTLVWVLFGMDCNYYKGLRQVYNVLEIGEVYTLNSKFRLENCRRIT